MEYKEFVEYIKMNAGYIAGEGGNITINHVIKNNGWEMDDTNTAFIQIQQFNDKNKND